MLPPEIRAITYFAFNPKRLIVDPITNTINSGFELVESIQFIACKVLDDEDCDKGIIRTKEEMIKAGIISPLYKPSMD